MTPTPELVATLRRLYSDGSRHAVYQNVPDFVQAVLGYSEKIDELWRGDRERYRCIERFFAEHPATSFGDVGANTGYFTLNLARRFPEADVVAYEPNPNHAQFVRAVADAFELRAVHVEATPLTLESLPALRKLDALLLLNVLHHAGFDFATELADDNAAHRAYCLSFLKGITAAVSTLVFQIGSNRGGRKDRPITPVADDAARLEWTVRLLLDAGWSPREIAYPRHVSGVPPEYVPMPLSLVASLRTSPTPSDAVLTWLGSLGLAHFPGEFYRRPLLFCTRAPSAPTA